MKNTNYPNGSSHCVMANIIAYCQCSASSGSKPGQVCRVLSGRASGGKSLPTTTWKIRISILDRLGKS